MDFGTAIVVQNGKYVDVQVLVISFPFSNTCFAYPLPAQNRECFMEGLKRLFARIGGVPKQVRIDNLAAAVAHIGPGEERQFTEMFERFKLHYRFEVVHLDSARLNKYSQFRWEKTTYEVHRKVNRASRYSCRYSGINLRSGAWKGNC